MKILSTAMLAVMLLALGACGGDAKQEEEKPKGVIPQHMIDGMEKAENVEDVLKQADEARREEIDSQ